MPELANAKPITQRLLVLLVAISLFGNIILTAFMYNAWSRNLDLLRKVQISQASIRQQALAEKVARCQQGNLFRAQDLELWTKVLALSATHSQTAHQARVTAQFQAFLVKHDAQTDCSQL